MTEETKRREEWRRRWYRFVADSRAEFNLLYPRRHDPPPPHSFYDEVEEFIEKEISRKDEEIARLKAELQRLGVNTDSTE
jgi:hypothetical protein